MIDISKGRYYQGCAEECSYPADMLFWSEEEQCWLCDCCWTMASEERGISLAEELKQRGLTR